MEVKGLRMMFLNLQIFNKKQVSHRDLMHSIMNISNNVLRHFSCVRLFVTLWTVAHQAPLSIVFSRQEYWSGLLCPPSGDLPYPGIQSPPLMSPELTGRFFTTSATWGAQ